MCGIFDRDERGGAFLQLVFAIPLLATLIFFSFRLSILTSSVPIVSSNLTALLESLELPSYVLQFDGIALAQSNIRANVSSLFKIVDPGRGTKKISAVLGLERQSHGAIAAAIRCRCSEPCGEILAETSADAGLDPQPGPSRALIVQACEAWNRGTQVSEQLSVDWSCTSDPRTEFVCYGAVVRFSSYSIVTRRTGAVKFDRVQDNPILPASQSATWQATAKLSP